LCDDPGLRIAFDGRTLTSPAGGVRRYVRELFDAIPKVLAGADLVAVGAADGSALPAGTRRAPANSLPTSLGWNLASLPLALRRITYDVFHAPAYGAPLWGVRPLVVTIHDVSYARHPEWYPYRTDPLRQAFYRASARRADRVITDSEFSRGEIVAAYEIDPARIDVVPLGVAAPFTADARVKREPFVLHVGDLHPRRNVAMLLDIVLGLRQQPQWSALRLVLAGADLGLLPELKRQARDAADALDYVGRPGDDTLADLYRRAGVFAYPSRYEGFGLPVLEAMACGTPVIGGKAGAVPEVLGDAGMLLDVDDARGWAAALEAVLSGGARAAELRERSIARASRFTWARAARETVAIYEEVARQNRQA
jgi:glycosyltransferase involved in cell wall biosynthesis